MRFSFHRRDADLAGAVRAQALRDLDEFVAVLVTQPEIRAQLAEALAALRVDFTEAKAAEHARLAELDRSYTQRMMDLRESASNANI